MPSGANWKRRRRNSSRRRQAATLAAYQQAFLWAQALGYVDLSNGDNDDKA